MEGDLAIDKHQFAQYIDHTLLKAGATRKEIRNLCLEAREYGFAAVCVNPCFVSLAAGELKRSFVKICTVIGFPLGANTTEIKVAETRQAVLEGADELDLVLNIGALKEGDEKGVIQETAAVIAAAKDLRRDVVVKLIAETSLLTEAEKRMACRVTTGVGADFIKNATGYGLGGATVEEIRFLRVTVGSACKVKASGGIRDLKTAQALLAAGADRLGTSSGTTLIRAWEQ